MKPLPPDTALWTYEGVRSTHLRDAADLTPAERLDWLASTADLQAPRIPTAALATMRRIADDPQEPEGLRAAARQVLATGAIYATQAPRHRLS